MNRLGIFIFFIAAIAALIMYSLDQGNDKYFPSMDSQEVKKTKENDPLPQQPGIEDIKPSSIKKRPVKPITLSAEEERKLYLQWTDQQKKRARSKINNITDFIHSDMHGGSGFPLKKTDFETDLDYSGIYKLRNIHGDLICSATLNKGVIKGPLTLYEKHVPTEIFFVGQGPHQYIQIYSLKNKIDRRAEFGIEME